MVNDTAGDSSDDSEKLQGQPHALAAALETQRFWRRMRALEDCTLVEQGVGHAFTSVTWQGSIAVEAMSTADGRIQGAADGVHEVHSDLSPPRFGILVSQDNRAELSFERLLGKLLMYAEPLRHNLSIDVAEEAAIKQR